MTRTDEGATEPMPNPAGKLLSSPRLGEVGWVLLPLRAFLSIVFLYAGISKIADSRFLDDNDPTGIRSTLAAVRPGSPVGSLLGPVQDHAFAFGVIFSIAEIAIGLGLLVGLFTRVAALGGMLLSLSFFLTVSWGATPWYTGADIGYVFALTPLVLAGAGGVYSVDAWLALAAREHPGAPADRSRRLLLGGAAAVGVMVLVGAASLTRRAPKADAEASNPSDAGTPTTPATSAGAAGSSSAAPTTAASSSAAAGPVLLATSAVAVGKAKSVKDPVSGDPAWVLQLTEGQFTALNATCPHAGCAVDFVSASAGFLCPCHQSRFTAAGKLISGQATRGLTSIPVTVVDGSVRRT
jgi:thiosulfate dehydrogenase [quinone] large subunit